MCLPRCFHGSRAKSFNILPAYIHLSTSRIISTEIFSNAMDAILRTRTKISNVLGLGLDSFSDK